MAPSVDLYYMPESAPCRMVEMVAVMIGVELNKHYVNLLLKDQLKEENLKINPRHKLPFLVDGDLRINESRAIMAYLVNKYKPESALYPQDPVQRARIDELLQYDIGTLYAALGKLFYPKFMGDANAPLNVDDEKAFKECFSYLDQRLADNGAQSFLLGNELTIADVAISTSVSFATDSFEYNIDEFSNLVNYVKRVKAAIPDYSKINDEPTENTKKFLRSRREQGDKK